jgi:hypothetical protein
MPTRQSTYFTGMSRRVEPEVFQAGVLTTDIVVHTMTDTLETTDVLELWRVAPGVKIVGFSYVTENMPAANVTFGFMTGTPGDKVAVRTVGNELINASAIAGPTSTALLVLSNLAPRPVTGDYVSIGMSTSAQITAAANRKIHIRIDYIIPSA